jgi:hypothetical protein
MNTMEYLLEKNKKFILSSIYQNTEYNGKTLCEYFGVESNTNKISPLIKDLVDKVLIKDFPIFNIYNIIDNKELYIRYKDMFLVRNFKLFNIGDILEFMKQDMFPCYYSMPTSLNQNFTITYYDNNSKSYIDKKYNRETVKEGIDNLQFYRRNIDNISIIDKIELDKYLEFKEKIEG